MASQTQSRIAARWLTRGVLGIGLASLFSDWGHEAATSVLPIFLAALGAPAVALGIVEGVSDGLASFAKLVGGYLADRPHWRKPVGVTGYSATALSTFSYSLAQNWPAVLIARALGWAGRGSRGPSRDALLADAVAPAQIGRAFGFERAMDTLGAVLGPLTATALVGTLGVRSLLRWTLVPGLAAAALFGWMAPKEPRAPAPAAAGAPHFRDAFRTLPSRFWSFLGGVLAHGLGDFAPTLLILRAAQILTPQVGTIRAATFSVALYTFHNFVSAAGSYPAGALGDRVGKKMLLAGGYALGVVVALGFIFAPPALPVLVLLFALAGLHQAVQQSLEKSLAAEFLPVKVRGTGFGVLAAANGIGDLVSSIAVGWLWSSVSPAAGFYYAGALSLVGVFWVARLR